MRSSVAVTLVLLLLLAIGLVVYRMSVHHDEAKSRLARSQLDTLGAKIKAFALDHGRFPVEPADLAGKSGSVQIAYARRSELIDPWGNTIYFRVLDKGQSFLLFTLGRDRVPGGSGPDSDLHVKLSKDGNHLRQP
jgi:general secretion pathway protein G